MGTITTASVPKSGVPGVNFWFGRQYAEHVTQYTQLFDVRTSKRSWEEIVELTGFGLVPVKDQNANTVYETELQGIAHSLTNVAYGLGFQVTREERDDNLYEIVGQRRAKALAFSFRTTKEIVHANIYNRADDSSYTGGDGKTLLATDHTSSTGGQANTLSTQSDLNEAAVEDILVLVMTAKNSKGHQISLRSQMLAVHPNDAFEAERLYASTQRYEDATNAVNAIRSMGMFPKGVHVNSYFDDSDQWFVRTDCPEGMISLQRAKMEFRRDNAFDSDNEKYKGYERYVPGWGDWRQVYGCSGA